MLLILTSAVSYQRSEDTAASHPPSDDVHVDQQSSQLQVFIVAVLQRDGPIPCCPTHTQTQRELPSQQTSQRLPELRTCLQAVDGKCGLSQEILVIEHVDFVHHEAQKGEGRVAHGELESLSGPGGIQTIIGWRGWSKNTACFECVVSTYARQELGWVLHRHNYRAMLLGLANQIPPSKKKTCSTARPIVRDLCAMPGMELTPPSFGNRFLLAEASYRQQRHLPAESVFCLTLSYSAPHTSISIRGQTIPRPCFGRCRAPNTFRQEIQVSLDLLCRIL